MRIVEYQPNTTTLSYRALRGVGIVAGIFSLVVCMLIIANHLTLKRSDPIHAPALVQLLEQLKASPQDEALKEQIRELDYLARRAFFSSQQFNQTAIYLLLAGLVVMVVSFKAIEACKKRYPYPNPDTPKDDLAENATWARKAVTAVGLVLVGFALVIAIPWNSPLNDTVISTESPVANAMEHIASEQAQTHTPAATAPETVQTPATIPAPVAFATRDEMLKNWPHFRGVSGGHVLATHLPVAWDGDSGQGIVWKSEIPKPGFSSPIVWNNRIFISGADQESREVFSFNVDDGALLWRCAVTGIPGSPSQLPKVNSDTGYAASTMATDGHRLFAIFANGDIVALDFDGQKIWGRNLGVPKNPYGHGSSLVVFEDVLLVQFDHEAGGELFGLNTATGETRWNAPREFGPSWASPALVEVNGKTEVILAASPTIASYDPRTGNELWRIDCLDGGEVAPTPVFANGLLYVAADHVALAAIDISTRAVAWRQEELMPGVCTPVVAEKFLIYGLNDGGIICRDAKTGEELWFEETDEGFYASPILAGNRVYLMDRTGVMHIFAAAGKFNSLGRPSIGEESVCTPAVAGNSIIYRGTKHLFRIGS